MKTDITDADALMRMLTRLKLTAIRDQLDSLLDTATRRKLTLLDTVKLLCEAEVARKDERRIQMASSIAKFPFVRTLDAFEFAAQPSLDRKLIHELATCRWIGTIWRRITTSNWIIVSAGRLSDAGFISFPLR